ncbi:hypothetical protein G5C51_16470 [Streptomyces sp. A7024]|uniref:VCBS repeat-containing protein n=1 Tax=Streptomyces coryli TaxID=1128680 RepID=A0A6G4TZT1_9ACTN|nr:hypothetical protein [Streptomyces coryli]NGN65485.1 hypothetical protein [Streptomyces coryli]
MRTHTLAAIAGCVAVLLAGCGSAGSGRSEEGGRATGQCGERSGPEGRGAKGAGDLDQDGYDDYATTVSIRDASSQLLRSQVAVVHGGKGGLDRHRVRIFDKLGLVPGARGDLDGDGYTDLLAQRNPDGPGTPVPVVIKGGPGCLGDPQPLKLPADFAAGAMADVNGDDALDLINPGHVPAVKGGNPGGLRKGSVAFGPFGKDGAPARTAALDVAAGGRPLTGDFNGDGFDDALILSLDTGEEEDDDPPPPPVEGYYRGSPQGLIRMPLPRTLGNATADGRTMPRAGDVDGDGIDDLLSYGDMPPPAPKPGAGRLTVVYGAKSGPGTGRPNSVYSQDTPGIPGDSQGADRFGPAATGDVTGDRRPDLVINTPGEDDDNGRFTLLPGAAHGPPTAAGATAFDLDTPGVPTRHKGTIHHGFHADFPLLDINGDTYADVVAAAPQYRVFRGGFWLFPGSAEGLAADTSRYTDPAGLGLRLRVKGG